MTSDEFNGKPKQCRALATFVAQVLVPTPRPGQTVVLDNLNVPTSARACARIEAVGCQRRVLPTSSPDLNPIELAFARVKQARRL
ncbi:MAG: transposase [Thermomicrobiales bacterium]